MIASRLVRAALAAAAAALLLPAGAHADTYLVGLTAKPLSTYSGGVEGIRATTPALTGAKLKADSAPALDYRSYLHDQQQDVLSSLPGQAPRVIYSYRNAFAGFAADLTATQAAVLSKDPDVSGVWKDALQQPDADGDPDTRLGGEFGESASYLRLSDPATGAWYKLGGPLAANGAGSGVIIGDIDTGIEPGHPSFADDPSKGYIGDPYTKPAVWDGTCQTGPGFAATDCNNKLIGARYYVDGFGAANLDPQGFLSPRDDDGHGTHTASTAAGNYGVDPSIAGNSLGVDVISGIAPRAYIAAYKVCWNGGPTKATGCATSDIVKAIDQAVADGVDVLNISLGSDTPEAFGAEELSMLNAVKAGVFIANSAGNAGPGAGTVGTPSVVPWTTSVAASSLERSFVSTVTVSVPGQPDFTIKGASVTGAVGPAPLVDASTAGIATATTSDAALCKDGTLDPTKVAGKIVLCLRGTNARVDKSLNVSLAGGVGMILYNPTDAQELDTDTHWVPTAHVNFTDGSKVKAAIAAGGATASLTAGTATATPHANPVMAAFSSRGPQIPVPDIPKPDVSAPGVQILAGAADQVPTATQTFPGQFFQAIAGTSMAAPHVAGAGALLTQAHSTLSAAEIKSALMLTANPSLVKEDGVTAATPFDDGSGQINPNAALFPGLVMDVSYNDYVAYLKGVNPAYVTGDITPKRPSDLNLPAIAWSRFIGKDSTTRTFTSIDQTATRWNVTVQAPTGISMTSSVSSFEIKPGQTQDVTVSATWNGAPINAWTYGALVLSDGTRTLRLPVSIKPGFTTVPGTISVAASTASGSQSIPVTPGFTANLSGLGWGLTAPVVHAAQTITATTKTVNLTGNDPGTQLFPLTVPTGAQLVSARLANADGGDPSTDLDLYVYRDPNGDGNYSDAVLAGSSVTTGSNEAVNLMLPTAGKYVVAVLGYATKATGSTYDLSTWVVNDALPDDASVPPAITVSGDPKSVSAGVPTTLTLNWSGLTSPGLYLGLVTYHASSSPTLSNIGSMSIVEVTSAVTPTPTPTPSPTPTDTPTPSPTPTDTPTPSPSPTSTDTPTPTPTPTDTPTDAPTATPTPEATVPPPPVDLFPSGGTPPLLGGLPPVHPAPFTSPKLVVRRVALSGTRTLALWLDNAGGDRVRVAIKHGSRFVSKSGFATASSTRLRLKLDRVLRKGHYTVKVIAVRGTAQTVLRAALKV